jgi:uncharacterized protein (DUF952 family)
LETEKTIFHLTTPQAWAAAQEPGAYAPEHYADEGFIHCSTQSQLLESANKHFQKADALIVLILPAQKLGEELKWEASRGGALFPHLYRPLSTEEVSGTFALQKNDEGTWTYSPGHL